MHLKANWLPNIYKAVAIIYTSESLPHFLLYVYLHCLSVVPKVWVTIQTRVAKDQKMNRAEAIPNWIVYFQRHLLVCASL